MGDDRLINPELWLGKLAQEDALREEERGILELFREPEAERDEDAPLQRDPGE